MSEKHARKYQNISNRAPQQGFQKRVVYKTVLDNPFRISWPKVAINVQNMLLARILDVLEGSAELHRSRKKILRLKRAASPSGCQRGKPELNDANQHGRILETGTMEEQPIIISADVPNTTENITSSAMQDEAMDHSQHLSIGINEVTKVLEGVCKENRLHISAQNADDGREIPSSDITRLVLVCQADVNPPTLIAHLPQLVASCNSLRQIPSPEEASTKTLLAPLPIGAEASISFALGFKRASVILIDVQSLAPQFSAFKDLIESIPILSAPWLAGQIGVEISSLTPTHIKQLKTTAPKNPKAAKEARLQARASSSYRKKKLKLRSFPRLNSEGGGNPRAK